jgi:hypothetical protein
MNAEPEQAVAKETKDSMSDKLRREAQAEREAEIELHNQERSMLFCGMFIGLLIEIAVFAFIGLIFYRLTH